MEELDKDTSLLARSAANHLTLSQLEPLRATLLSLRHRNPDLARSFLQTSIANASIFPNSSLLAFISLLDLLRFPDAADIWPFSVQVLRLRVEFALCVDQIASRVSRSDEAREEGLELVSDSADGDELRDAGSDAVVEEIASRVSRGLDSSVEESGLGSDSAVLDDSSDLPDSGLKIGITTEDVASSISDLTVISKLSESGSGAVIEEEDISSRVSKLPVLNRSKQDSGSESGQVLEERDSRFSGLKVLEKLSESSSGAVTEKEDFDSRVSKLPILNRSKQDSGSNSGLVLEERDSRFSGLKVLEKLSELALNRLRPDDSGVVLIEEEEIYSIKGLVLENAELFDVLCANVQKQIKGDEAEGGEGMRVLRLVQKMVQVAHLNAISVCLDGFDVDRALSHVRFLHLEWGVEESEYR